MIDEGKPRISLIPKAATWAAAEAFTYGAKKHGAYAWREDSHTITQMLDKALRHLTQFQDGEDFDKDSKLHHLASVLADVSICVDLYYNYSHLDDRFKRPTEDDTLETEEASIEEADVIIEQSDMRYITQGTRIIGKDGRNYVTAVNGTFPVKEGDRLIYGS